MGGICSSNEKHIFKPVWLDHYNLRPDKYIIVLPKSHDSKGDLLSHECNPSTLKIMEIKYFDYKHKIRTNQDFTKWVLPNLNDYTMFCLSREGKWCVLQGDCHRVVTDVYMIESKSTHQIFYVFNGVLRTEISSDQLTSNFADRIDSGKFTNPERSISDIHATPEKLGDVKIKFYTHNHLNDVPL